MGFVLKNSGYYAIEWKKRMIILCAVKNDTVV